MKKVVLSVFPNKFVWLVGVDVEFVLPCRSDPLGKHVLQIEVEVFHAVATTTEHGEDGPYYLAL